MLYSNYLKYISLNINELYLCYVLNYSIYGLVNKYVIGKGKGRLNEIIVLHLPLSIRH